ncbi:hypothetical protein H5410_033874 [Solanum commersonii]|uniref:Uncharacterized protein n=1 Tax=Solanum commersonii TaxID=4109 RepID=A0A9J5YS08_SOLCO|nr:hypothetical protein H5410_033874 [Solanum commersonii]
MAGREVREYTNLTDPKDKKFGKGKDKIDDEEVTFQRMVSKVSESRFSNFIWDPGFSYWVLDMFRCKMLLGNVEVTFMEEALYIAALDSDDLLYLKEQMEAEEDAERLLRRTEKRAFQAFKISFLFLPSLMLPLHNNIECLNKAVADSSPASIPLPLRVEPKPKSGIRQQDVLKRVLEVKPKRQKVSRGSDGSNSISSTQAIPSSNSDSNQEKQKDILPAKPNDTGNETKVDNPIKSLVAAYESSDDED